MHLFNAFQQKGKFQSDTKSDPFIFVFIYLWYPIAICLMLDKSFKTNHSLMISGQAQYILINTIGIIYT